MFFINFYATIAPFLIRTRVKYPETLKGNGPYHDTVIKIADN
jgi:hypothetical protein